MSNIILCSYTQKVCHQFHRYLDINPKEAKTLFIETAAEGDDAAWGLDWLERDRQALKNAGFNITQYTITGKSRDQISKDLDQHDIIYVNGGNAFYLLKQMLQTDCMDLIVNQVKAGKTYIGSSSGAMIAGPNIQPALAVVPEDPKLKLTDYSGLNLVNYIIIPHWGADDEDWKQIYLKENSLTKVYNTNHKLILLRENQIIVNQDNWFKIIDIKSG